MGRTKMDEGFIIPLAAILMPLALVPTIITLVHRHKRREWKHQERLRALDLGLTGPLADARPGGGSVAAIGAGVPIASVVGSLIATLSIPESHPDYMPIVAIAWGCAVLISAGALVTSLVLGVMQIRSHQSANAPDQFASLKPAYEPDAYDVVSRRG
jgi:hypothetical protein